MSVYSIVSAVFLIPVTLLWQRSDVMAFVLTGAAAWVARGLLILVFPAFLWGMLSLKPFDPFGIIPLKAFVRGRRVPQQPFRVRGAYRWVRHPLYFCMIAILWLNPQLSVDAVFGNALWTSWILAATILEEKDLVVDFGDAYRLYRRTVPMLIPWRGPAPRV
jgi:protein-S-isoprenylcysteine O-methyltransferase Ste14